MGWGEWGGGEGAARYGQALRCPGAGAGAGAVRRLHRCGAQLQARPTAARLGPCTARPMPARLGPCQRVDVFQDMQDDVVW